MEAQHSTVQSVRQSAHQSVCAPSCWICHEAWCRCKVCASQLHQAVMMAFLVSRNGTHICFTVASAQRRGGSMPTPPPQIGGRFPRFAPILCPNLLDSSPC